MTDRYMSDHKDRMEHSEVEEAVNKKIQRYAMAYEGILPQESIERSKQHWRNELLDFADEITTTFHHQLQKAREEVLPYLKEYKQTLDCDWSVNPVQVTTLVYRSPETVLRDQANEIERKRTMSSELGILIDRYQAELDQPTKNKKYCNGEPCTCHPELDQDSSNTN